MLCFDSLLQKKNFRCFTIACFLKNFGYEKGQKCTAHNQAVHRHLWKRASAEGDEARGEVRLIGPFHRLALSIFSETLEARRTKSTTLVHIASCKHRSVLLVADGEVHEA